MSSRSNDRSRRCRCTDISAAMVVGERRCARWEQKGVSRTAKREAAEKGEPRAGWRNGRGMGGGVRVRRERQARLLRG